MAMGQSRPVARPHPVQKDPFNGPPKPFAFKYGVNDADTGMNYDHAQQQDSNGVVTGKQSRFRDLNKNIALVSRY